MSSKNAISRPGFPEIDMTLDAKTKRGLETVLGKMRNDAVDNAIARAAGDLSESQIRALHKTATDNGIKLFKEIAIGGLKENSPYKEDILAIKGDKSTTLFHQQLLAFTGRMEEQQQGFGRN